MSVVLCRGAVPALALALAACQVGVPYDGPAAGDGFREADAGGADATEVPDEPSDPTSVPPGNAAQRALDFGLSLVGTPYGWWYSGPLPEGEPMWTADGPPPPADLVRSQSANCTGLTNLMLRSIDRPLPTTAEGGTGGTYSYAVHFADVAEPFDASRIYPAGTLLGRAYRDTYDQGHVAVVLANGRVLQSFAFERDGSSPGVNTTYTVAESHDGGFYEYIVLPEDWLGARPDCGWGDGLYCGGNGVAGDEDTLYECVDGTPTVVQVCAAGCERAPAGLPDGCAASP